MTPPRRRYGYGSRPNDPRSGHYLQSYVRPDVWQAIQQLIRDHGLTISGAAHHLMRLGAGLHPLAPIKSDDD